VNGYVELILHVENDVDKIGRIDLKVSQKIGSLVEFAEGLIILHIRSDDLLQAKKDLILFHILVLDWLSCSVFLKNGHCVHVSKPEAGFRKGVHLNLHRLQGNLFPPCHGGYFRMQDFGINIPENKILMYLKHRGYALHTSSST